MAKQRATNKKAAREAVGGMVGEVADVVEDGEGEEEEEATEGVRG